jgi:hypothetical protein
MNNENETTLALITSVMDGYINKRNYSAQFACDEIQRLIEENYIHGSLDNEYK